jgi:hypothetical protein
MERGRDGLLMGLKYQLVKYSGWADGNREVRKGNSCSLKWDELLGNLGSFL